MNEFHIYSIVDFYKLSEEKIATIPGFGDKSANNIVTGIKKSLLCIIAYQGRKIPRYHPDSHILYLYGLSFCLTCSDRRRLKILVFTCAAPVGKFTCWRIIRKLTADDFLSLYVVQMLLTHSLLFTHFSFYHSLLLCVKIKDIGKCNILKIKSENFLPFLSN